MDDCKASEPHEISGGPLSVRIISDGERHVISLRGELDLANVQAVKRELNEALRDEGGGPVVVDMRELDFIDSAGIALLVVAINRGGSRLRFIASESPAVGRVLALTGLTRWMEPAGVGITTPPHGERQGVPTYTSS